MSIMVQIAHAQEQKALCDRLHTWMALACVSMNLVTPETSTPDDPPQILFWDLDLGEPPLPAREDQALFLCSRDPQRAIDSYSFHPTDFLPMPVSMERLWSAMLRCTRLWFPHLLRLEILSDRVRVGVPYQNLIWVEGTRRGCMLHTSHQSIASREPLYRLEQRLPPCSLSAASAAFWSISSTSRRSRAAASTSATAWRSPWAGAINLGYWRPISNSAACAMTRRKEGYDEAVLRGRL